MEAFTKFFMKMAVKKKMGDMGLGGEKDGGLLGGGNNKEKGPAKPKNPKATCEGVLMKKSKWAGRWDKRYFVLDGATLKYWEGETQGNGVPKGHFRINVHTNAIEDQSDKQMLVLTVNDEDIVMKAKSVQDCARWVEALQKLIVQLRRDDKKNGGRVAMKARHDAIRAKYGLNKKENLNSKKK